MCLVSVPDVPIVLCLDFSNDDYLIDTSHHVFCTVTNMEYDTDLSIDQKITMFKHVVMEVDGTNV